MEKLFQTMQKIEDAELPFDVSGRVIGQILRRKLQTLMVFMLATLASFAYLSYRIYVCLMETGAISILNVIVTDFELSSNYISESWAGLVETMPVTELRYLAVNVAVMIALGVYYLWFRRTKMSLFSSN